MSALLEYSGDSDVSSLSPACILQINSDDLLIQPISPSPIPIPTLQHYAGVGETWQCISNLFQNKIANEMLS